MCGIRNLILFEVKGEGTCPCPPTPPSLCPYRTQNIKLSRGLPTEN
jgi:hypothetical protein